MGGERGFAEGLLFLAIVVRVTGSRSQLPRERRQPALRSFSEVGSSSAGQWPAKGNSQRGFAKGIRKGDSQRGFAKALLSLSIAIRVAVPRSKRPQYPISNPLRNGIISDWKIARPSDILQLCFRGVAAKTESHRKIAEQMSFARARASSPAMSRAEFLAQTPKELRVSRPGGLKSRKSSER